MSRKNVNFHQTVVAKKMLKRVTDDVQWLASAAAQAALDVPKLLGFENDPPVPSGAATCE